MIEATAKKALEVCHKHGWSRGWSEAGCYLHLEVSEFIEALRGKGDSDPTEEAGDVMFVLLSTCKANGIDLQEVFDRLDVKMDQYLVNPPKQPPHTEPG